jgi:transcription elongation GreA/GreB family factor
MHIKQQIHGHFIDTINNKILILQQTLADLKESGSNETKSTAGDKHETALAMLQIEQTNTRTQLQDALEQRLALLNINPGTNTAKILPGSYVKTDKGNFYLSVALGKLIINGETIMAISPQSPLGAKLLGSCIHDTVTTNGNAFLVERIE